MRTQPPVPGSTVATKRRSPGDTARQKVATPSPTSPKDKPRGPNQSDNLSGPLPAPPDHGVEGWRPSDSLGEDEKRRWWGLYKQGLVIYRGDKEHAAARAWAVLQKMGQQGTTSPKRPEPAPQPEAAPPAPPPVPAGVPEEVLPLPATKPPPLPVTTGPPLLPAKPPPLPQQVGQQYIPPAVTKYKDRIKDANFNGVPIKTVTSTADNQLTADEHKLIGQAHAVAGKAYLDAGQEQLAQAHFAAARYHNVNSQRKSQQAADPNKVAADRLRLHLSQRISGDIITTPNLTPERKKQYIEGVNRALRDMPQAALDRLAKTESVWYESSEEVGKVFYGSSQLTDTGEELKSKGARIAGFQRGRGDSSSVHLDGAEYGPEWSDYLGIKRTPAIHGAYAHEMTHAIDRADPSNILSKQPEWEDAWKSEIGAEEYIRRQEEQRLGVKIFANPNAKYKLSKYATNDPTEGFAEFGRLIYGSEFDHQEAEELFPKATNFLKKNGLWPSSAAMPVSAPKQATPERAAASSLPADALPTELGESPKQRLHSLADDFFGKDWKNAGDANNPAPVYTFPDNKRYIQLQMVDDDTVSLDFGIHGEKFTYQAKELQAGTLDFVRKIREIAVGLKTKGFRLSVTPSDERRRKMYEGLLTRSGLKKVEDGPKLPGLVESTEIWMAL